MSMLMYLIPDLVIIAVLALFCWRGAKRGMILTLCSLAALLVAFVGAVFFTRLLAPVVSAQFEPMLAGVIEQAITEQSGSALPGEFDLGPLDIFIDAEWYDDISTAVEQGVSDGIAVVSKRIAAVLADAISYIVLFFFSFVAILLIWFVISHALDLAFRLPALSTFNTAGGLLLGLLRGLILLFILGAVARRYPSLQPDSMASQTYLLRFFLETSPFALLP